VCGNELFAQGENLWSWSKKDLTFTQRLFN
jgi:hypothetical protein